VANVGNTRETEIQPLVVRPTLKGHLAIARFDHWVKNVFVLPGIVVALSIDHSRFAALDIWTLLIGFLAVGLIASSNYVINEVLDARHDRTHPTKRLRPVPAGLVSIPWAYVEWLALMVAGLALSWRISLPFTLSMAALWVMGCVYNIPPVRSKDLPYLDVLSEAINNPLRMLAGWYLTGTAAVPPASLLVAYWMVGCYFMAIKRYAEYREIADAERSAAYRKSFAHYTSERLLVSILFYASSSMLFFGAFLIRYRMELILAFPLISWVMAIYFSLAFRPDSAAQRPEGLYREPVLMIAVTLCAVVMTVLLFVDVPLVYRMFKATELVR
jgi:decaprenyl-phosphate phosphoribosyltransferase